MNTTIQPETPARTDTYSLNLDTLEHVGTAAADRSEKTRISISEEATENLKSKMKGQVVLPSDPSYDEVRQIWNAMIDRRPALIVRCAEASDVPHAISFARENGLEISVRGGGHNIAGNALCDNGVMIDLSAMRNVRPLQESDVSLAVGSMPMTRIDGANHLKQGLKSFQEGKAGTQTLI